MEFKKWIILIGLCVCIIIPQIGCKSEAPVSENQFLLNTVCTVTVYNMKQSQAQEAIKEAFACCRQYEDLLSKTVRGSDVDNINRAGGKAVRVHPETLAVVRRGIEYGDLSRGMFDITIGAVTELWDFTGEHPKVPPAEELKKAVRTVDYKQIRIEGDKVKLQNPEARLDLGGIAKGYIADRVTERMEKAGVRSAVINLGGNIATIGEKEKGVPWKIGIERPYSERTKILGSVEMESGTIVTSGIYERYFKEGGRIYHHVLNPKTGYPVDSGLEAVTIKGGSGRSMDCDALSTMCLMLGAERSMEILKGMDGIEAAFVDQSDQITQVKGMKILPAE